MAKIFFKTFLDLKPLPFKYELNGKDVLNTESIFFDNGITAIFLKGLEGFQDSTINKNTSLTLTNLQPLSGLFKPPISNSISHSLTLRTISPDQDFYPYYLKKKVIGDNTEGFILQENKGKIIIKKEPTRIQYDFSSNTFKRSFYESTFFIQRIENSEEVEIFVEGKQVRIQKNYPYTVEVRKQDVDYNDLYRQRFYLTKEKDNSITIKIKTPEGFRYLAFCSDGVLRATGNKNNPQNIHNETSGYNDYVFYYKNVSPDTQIINFYPTNNWITYHQTP